MSKKSKRIALALGGGGARGFAHVGVLEFMEKKGLPVKGIVGSSAGAIAAAGWAMGKKSTEMRESVIEFSRTRMAADPLLRSMVDQDIGSEALSLGDRLFSMFCRGRMVKSLLLGESLMPKDYFAKVIEFFLPDILIEEMEVPFAAVATDIMTGEPVVLNKGSLRKAVLASCSIPGVAPVVSLGNRHLVDGGVASLVPVHEARSLFGGPVVAVNLERKIEEDLLPRGALDMYLRASDLQALRISELLLKEADLALHPEVKDVHWADFLKCETVMENGERAAEKAWPELLELTRKKSPFGFLKGRFCRDKKEE
ncbi:patatin-like phospholipase family protein [Dethiosulfatarculus sandiegensis]|uniref:PNPLA domain-containing protein n=1 Tax=Dethiosulfatarculus sandiegensis TaxID=1429043 RepID=A0A0D2GGR5_9BACT|nr:patatin-like phospholipase family protein [Dethiosulfatarculus sandiegensis]KIX14102.1 hypothetical protein X474_10740 [Dethiosulfatarculus sandiegensis]